jgi:hypothetical protein
VGVITRDDFDYFVVGESQGKFKEENGKLKCGYGRFTLDELTFDILTFEQELEQIEGENKASGLKRIKDRHSYDI